MLRFGEIALQKGYMTAEQVKECLREQQAQLADGKPEPIGKIALRKKYIKPEQIQDILKEQGKAIPARIGRYRVLEKVGQGAMGAVFKARDENTNRIVALKILPPRYSKSRTFVTRFMREARAAGKLNHPNIVQGLDAGESDGLFYFAMEYVDGDTVRVLLREKGVLEEKEALAIVAQVCKALEHAAEHNMVHRDVKPENILLTSTGQAKLADLGLAREVSSDASLTQAGEALGTPFYISPEQAQGLVDIDPRSDIYSLGATLFHLVTGKVPFDGVTPAVIMTKHINDPLPDPKLVNPKLSDGVCTIIRKAMMKKREDRYQTPADMLEDVEKVLRGEPIEPPVVGPAGTRTRLASRLREERAARNRRLMIYFSFFGLGACVVGLYYLGVFGQGGSPPPPPTTSVTTSMVQATTTVEDKSKIAEGLFKEADEYAKKFPEDLPTIRKMYRAAAEKGGPEWVGKAAIKIKEAEESFNGLAKAEYEKAKKAKDEALAKGNYREAIAALEAFARLEKFKETSYSGLAETAKEELQSEAKSTYEKRMAEAKELVKTGELKKAREVLAQVTMMGYEEYAREANAMAEKIEEEEKGALAKAERNELTKLRENFLRQMASSSFDDISQELDKAASRKWNDPAHLEEVQRMQSDVKVLRQIVETSKGKLKELAESQEKTILKGLEGQVESFDGKNIAFKVAMTGTTKTYALTELKPQDIFLLAGIPERTEKGPDAVLKRAMYLLLVARDYQAAKKELESGSLGERAKPYLAIIESAEIAELDKEASRIFEEAQAEAKQNNIPDAIAKLESLGNAKFARSIFVEENKEKIQELILTWRSSTEAEKRKKEKAQAFRDITSTAGDLGEMALEAPMEQSAGACLWANLDNDKDDKLDLVFGRCGERRLKAATRTVVLVQKEGKFVTAAETPLELPKGLAADFDLDGKLEIVAATRGGLGIFKLVERKRRAHFEQQFTVAEGERYGYSDVGIAVGDFDADGLPDINACLWGGNLYFYMNETTQKAVRFEQIPENTLPKPFVQYGWRDRAERRRLPGNGYIATADINFDGSTDFLYNRGKGLIYISKKAKFEPYAFSGPEYDNTVIEQGGWEATSYKFGPVWGDFDSDGDFDVFVPQKSDSKLFRNDGPAGFRDVTDKSGDLAKVFPNAVSGVWADFNLDGFLDLVVLHTDTRMELFINNGDGTFSDRTKEWGLAKYDRFTHIAAADFDGDGDIDLFLNRNGGGSRLLENQFAAPDRQYYVEVIFRGSARRVGTIVRLHPAESKKKVQIRMLGAVRGLSDQEPVDVAHFGVPSSGRYEVEILIPGLKKVINRTALVSSTGKGAKNVLIVEP